VPIIDLVAQLRHLMDVIPEQVMADIDWDGLRNERAYWGGRKP
jgi:hypothetical protein